MDAQGVPQFRVDGIEVAEVIELIVPELADPSNHDVQTVPLGDSLGTPDAQLTAIDVGDQVEVRERAIACHRSQSSPFDGLSPELRHR